MIKVLFFAQLRESLNCAELRIELNDPKFASILKSAFTLEQLREQLANTDDTWQLNMQNGKLLMAVNQTIVNGEHILQDGDEVAFFPPVTGG